MKKLKIFRLLELHGVVKDGKLNLEAVKALCKSYARIYGVTTVTTLEVLIWAVNTFADFEGVELTVEPEDLKEFVDTMEITNMCRDVVGD
jgi:uncharacterized protein YunC (DUF1805 family)